MISLKIDWKVLKILLFLWKVILAKSRDFIMNGRGDMLWKNDILRYITKGWDIITIGRDILRKVKILIWMVEIFMVTGQDFHDDSYERLRFSWW